MHPVLSCTHVSHSAKDGDGDEYNLRPERACAACIDRAIDEARAELRAQVAAVLNEAIHELDSIGCAPFAPCEGPVERAIRLLLRLIGQAEKARTNR